MISFEFSEQYSDVSDIHDALYSYNLSKTKLKRANIHAERHREQGVLLARDENGTSYGGIAYHWKNEPRHIYVDFFFLDEAIRGTGIGKKMFEQFIVWARDNGACRIDLETNTFQAPGFYQKMGFRITGEEAKPTPGFPENIHYDLTLDL